MMTLTDDGMQSLSDLARLDRGCVRRTRRGGMAEIRCLARHSAGHGGTCHPPGSPESMPPLAACHRWRAEGNAGFHPIPRNFNCNVHSLRVIFAMYVTEFCKKVTYN